MKILVTGGNGQLGMSLRRVAASVMPGDSLGLWPRNYKENVIPSEASVSHEFIFADITPGPDTVKLDITDRDAVMAFVKERGIEAIVNCAAYTNVDKAESDYETAELLNATAVGYLAEAMKAVGGLLVHISTDYVFGKEPYNTPCNEDQKGTPTGVYGLTKLHGEQTIAASGCRAVIIRTAWLYSEYGRNFVKTMLQLTAERPLLKVVFDQVGTPTYAGDLAEAIVKYVLSNEIHSACRPRNDKNAVMPGPDRASHVIPSSTSVIPGEASVIPSEASVSQMEIYHYSNEGVCSWYDFAKMIAEYAGHTSCDIQPCHSEEFPSPVHRPAYSVLDKSKIKETFGLKIPYWTESLRKCIKNLEA